MSKREGVCCTCQSVHPVRPNRHTSDDPFGFNEELDLDGEVGEWVMDTHDAFGSHCEGSGTMPQALVSEPSRDWTDLSDDEIKAAVKEIVRTSESDDEIKRRVADELGNPYGMAITSHLPTDDVGQQAQALVECLGGPVRKDGAMVMIMMHGPNGNTISI